MNKMDKGDLHYKPKYLTPKHALIPKKCKFCHNDMEIKQINSTEALRMCFKCSTPFQQLDIEDIEFFHRSYKDVLKSPLEWNTNVSEEDDDLGKLSLWIEQMELKVSKYEDSSDDETLGSSTKNQKPVGEIPENSSIEGSLHDWQSEVYNELEVALKKASSENSQSNNFPFSFDDFFLPSNPPTSIENDSCASSASCVGSMEGAQKLSAHESICEISQDIVSQTCEKDLSQSHLIEIHENSGHLEEVTTSTNTKKIYQNVSEESKPIEDKRTITVEQLLDTKNKIDTNNVQEKDLNTDCSANQSTVKSGNVYNKSEIQQAALECLENESSLQAGIKQISEQDSLKNISEKSNIKGNITELVSSNTFSHLETVPIIEGNNILLSAQNKFQATFDAEKGATEDMMEIQDCITTNEQEICQIKTNSLSNKDLENDGEACGSDKKDMEGCVGIKTRPSALLKNCLYDNLSDSDSSISSATQLLPVTSVTKGNAAESESLIQYSGYQNDERPMGELRKTSPEILPLSSESQIENNISTVVLTNKCGSTLPLNLWSSLSQCLNGNTLMYEHVCDCDEKQIQLSPANNDHDNQCINLVLPDLSPSSLIEKDILKPNKECHSLDKILFVSPDKSVKKKCSSRKLNFLETHIERTNESYEKIPIFIVPADSDITEDMLQIEPDDTIPIIFSDSVENTSIETSLERSFTPSFTVNSMEVREPLPLNVCSSTSNSKGPICLNNDLGQTSLGKTDCVEDFHIKINFAPDINDTSLISGDNLCKNDVAQEKKIALVEDLDKINVNLHKNPRADSEYSDIESYDSNSHFETSNYSQFIEGIDSTCSSSITVKKGITDSMEENSFSMMIDRPLQLHGITIEEDDEELKCFAGAKFRPIANRKPSLKEGKIESEPRVMNLLKSVRREVKMAKAPNLENET